MKTGFVLLALIVLGFLFSCNSGGTPDPNDGGGPHIPNPDDTTYPGITILKPVTSQNFQSGDTIKVEGTVTDNGLYRGSIRITNTNTGAMIREQLYEIHGLQVYNFNLQYKTAVSSAVDYTVTVQFEDHGYNITSKSVGVRVNP